MSTELPDPLVGQDVDLRDFGFMPLDVLRLRDSDLATLATGDEFKAAVLLWCAAWHQIPAGSIPNDERWLARHSGAGATWKKVREEALRGFVLCSDGRLYHRIVSAKANESWTKKQEQRAKTLKARIAGLNKRINEATTDAEKLHLQDLLQTLSQTLSQSLSHSQSQGLSQTLSQPPRDSKGTVKVRESKGNSSNSPAGAVAAKPDPVKDEIWKTGKSILEKQGESRESAGSFLGKLCKDYGQVLVLDAVRDAAKTTPAEAKAWLIARCQERRQKGGESLYEKNLRAVGMEPGAEA